MAIGNLWGHLTPKLLFCVVVFLQGGILFGIDTGSFGALQALPSFLNRFGVDDGTGVMLLPPTRKALMNSLPWIGKIAGCFGAEPIIERFGFKNTMYVAAVVQLIAVTIEMASNEWGQFTAGRVVAYFAVGLVENIVPSYNAEIAPAPVRGLLSGNIIVVSSLGNLWGASMSRAYPTTTHKIGWLLPTAMQYIPAIGLLILVPFTIESPRWLLLKGHRQDAKAALDKIRKPEEVESGATAAEIEAIDQLIEESKASEQGTWLDLFKGNYLRRTWISCTLFVIQQTNGNQFVQSYAPTFYVQQGLGAMAFTYNIIGSVIGLVGCTIGVFLFDIAGRRPLMIYGSVVCAFLLYLASGLGLDKNPTQAGANTTMACFMILPAFCRLSASNTAFLTGAEIGGVRMRKKVMAMGTASDVAAAFLVTFFTPYILPNMGVNIGWIFGSVAAFSVIWSFLFFPELKGRSLEEVDELFGAGVAAWKFSKYETHGTGRLLSSLETGGIAPEKLQQDCETQITENRNAA